MEKPQAVYAHASLGNDPIQPRAKNEPVIAIELLRFLCAVAVMAMHYSSGFWIAPGVEPKRLLQGIEYRSPLEWYTQIGWVGVELFFVISGMVIARSAVGARPLDFFRRRFLRLAPAVWICATLTAAIVAIAGAGDLDLGAAWLRSMAFWPVGQQIDGSYWTLGIEICFYGLVFLVLKLRGDTAINLERLAWVMAASGALFWFYMTATLENWAHTGINRPVQLSLLPHGCFFAIGICIAQATSDAWNWKRITLLGVAALPAIAEIVIHSIEGGSGAWSLAAIPALGVVVAGCAILVAASSLQPLLRCLINPRLARSVGAATFPLYLIHQDAGAAVTALLVGSGIVSASTALCICVALAIGTAWVIAQWLEPALRTVLNRIRLPVRTDVGYGAA